MNRYIMCFFVLLLSGCLTGQSGTPSRSSSYPEPSTEEGILTYGITSEYGNELTWSASYTLRTDSDGKKTYQFPRGDGPPVGLEFMDDKAKIDVSDLNSILTRLGLAPVDKSIFETPDLAKPRYARYLFDWNTPEIGKLSLEVVLCVCKRPSITECPEGTTKRMGSKYYYCIGKIEHVER